MTKTKTIELTVPEWGDEQAVIPEGATPWESQQASLYWRNALGYYREAIERIANAHEALATDPHRADLHVYGNDAQKLHQAVAAQTAFIATVQGIEHRLALASAAIRKDTP